MSVREERVANRRSPTDQQLLQQTLLGEAVEGASFAVFVFDEDRNHVAVNEAACALTGYTRQELLDLEVFPLFGLAGRGSIRRKDGTDVEVDYRVAATSVAGAQFFISICYVV